MIGWKNESNPSLTDRCIKLSSEQHNLKKAQFYISVVDGCANNMKQLKNKEKDKTHTNTHTYPLILGQRVVDHQILLAFCLARVGDVLQKKQQKTSYRFQ